MKRWIKRIALSTLALFFLVGSVAAVAFLRWRKAIVERLENGSAVVATSSGPVEYATFGEGRAVLYLHGSPGGFDQIIALLRAQYGDAGPGFRAIVPSRPGYLRTPLRTGRTPAEQADAMAALLDVLRVRRVAVLGGSDGGPSALLFAARHPDRCSALILLSAVTQRISGEPSALFRSLPTDLLIWAVLQTPERMALERAGNDPIRAAMLREVTRTIVPFERRRAGKQNDSAQDAVLPALPFQEVRCPTLILHGTRDRTVPFAQAEAAHAQIAGSRLVRYEVGHLLLFTKHREVAAAIDAFLAERGLEN